MVYKTARSKILIILFFATLFITFIAGSNYWRMWFILPFSVFFLYICGKAALHFNSNSFYFFRFDVYG